MFGRGQIKNKKVPPFIYIEITNAFSKEIIIKFNLVLYLYFLFLNCPQPSIFLRKTFLQLANIIYVNLIILHTCIHTKALALIG